MRDCKKRLVGFLFPQDPLYLLILKQLIVYFSIAKFYRETFQDFEFSDHNCKGREITLLPFFCLNYLGM